VAYVSLNDEPADINLPPIYWIGVTKPDIV